MLGPRSESISRSASGRVTQSASNHSAGARVVRRLKRHPVLYALLALMVLLFASAMATGFDLAVRLNYILLFLLVISWLWARAGAGQIEAEVRRPIGPFSVGDTVFEKITLHNRGRAPKAWVEVEDRTNIPGVSFRHVTGLGLMVPFSSLEASARLTKRGEFVLGPLFIRVSDPFAIFPQEIEFEGADKVLVYPRILSIPDFAAPNLHLVGDHSRRQRANVVSTDVASVRDYAAGDSISRIHWLSTVRTGHLMVKQFDQGSASHLWILFDQYFADQGGEGEESTDEYGATVAASVVDRYSKGFLPVGFVSHGSESLISMPDRSMAQRQLVLRHIAASEPVGDVPLMDMLADREREFSQSTSLVIITAAGDGTWVHAVAGLQRRGVKISVVLLDRASFGGTDNSTALTGLVKAGVRTYRIRQGDSIPAALVAPVSYEQTDEVAPVQKGTTGANRAPQHRAGDQVVQT